MFSVEQNDIKSCADPKERARVFRQNAKSRKKSRQDEVQVLGLFGGEVFGKHPETQKPEEAHRCVGHDENACDDKGINGCRVKESSIESGLGIFYLFPDAENDVGVGRHENHGGKTDEELAVEQQVKAEKLNHPAHHARMVEMAPVGKFGVSPLIDFIVAEFKPSCQKTSY